MDSGLDCEGGGATDLARMAGSRLLVNYQLTGDLTIRGVTRQVTLTLRYLGRWRTPYNNARVARLGFTGETRINRHDFAMSWNSQMENAGTVVGSDVLITIDVEAILDTDLRPILERASIP